ncbi:hypothetical protein V8D89_003964 [Ganoderma adspersum]
MAPSTPDRHTFLPSASPNKCAKCARGKGSPYHINPATLFSWTPPTFTPTSPPAPDIFSDVPDCFDPLHDDPDSDLESDASDDEGVPAHILAEFEETTRILDDLREYADQAFKALPNPAFTHPLRYAMHLMKVGFTHLRAPPDPAPSSPPPPTPLARVLSDAATSTPVRMFSAPAPSPPPTPARTPMRSTSPPPCSPSMHEDFNKVLARLNTLRKEVSPPPSPPPTPRAASPTPHTAGEAAHLHLIIAVPHGVHSLTLDLVEHASVNNLYREFPARPATANARAHRGRLRGRPVASPVRHRQHSL